MIKYLRNSLLLVVGVLLPQWVLAASSSILAPNLLSPTQGDLSMVYLADIFGIVDGVLHGTGSQIMGAMFSVFNAGALALGAIIIMYTTLISTLNTAHQGEPLGKDWSSMWIPIRSAMGIGLLIPKATGYCTIQIFLMWAIVQGVGVADHVWDSALLYIGQGGMVVQSSSGTANIGTQLSGVLTSEVCMFGLQKTMEDAYQSNMSPGPTGTATQMPAVPALISTVLPFPSNPTCGNGSGSRTANCIDFPGNSNGQTYDPNNIMEGVCGKISWPASTAEQAPGQGSMPNNVVNVYEANLVAVQQIVGDMAGPAQILVNALMPSAGSTYSPTATPATNYVSTQTYVNAANDFQGIMEPYYAQAAKGGGTLLAGLLTSAAQSGWILAGSYYPILVMSNAATQKMVTATPTATSYNYTSSCVPGSSVQTHDLYTALPGPFQSGANTCTDLNNLTTILNASGTGTISDLNSQGKALVTAANSAGNSAYSTKVGLGAALTFMSTVSGAGAHWLDLFMGPMVGDIINLITQFITLGTSEFTNANPVVALAMMGLDMMDLVVTVWIAGAVAAGVSAGALGLVPCMTVSAAVNATLTWLVPFLWAILGLLFVNGAVMAYYVPFIPFILVTFGALHWFILVLEAMCAGPLIALGITHPEGHPVLGKADPAVLMLVNVFIRPSLMVIGFIGGVILSYVGVWLLNRGFYSPALGLILGGYLSFSPLALLMSFPFLMVMYTVLVIAIVNESFGLIHAIPDRVMMWLGQQMGSAGNMSEKALNAAKGGVESTAQGMSQGAQSGISDLQGKAAQKQSSGQKGNSGGPSNGGGAPTGGSVSPGESPSNAPSSKKPPSTE